MKLKNILEKRLDLAAIYVKFHTEADFVNKEMDKLEESLQNTDNVDEDTIERLEEAWESLVPLYQSTKNTGLTFISEASKVGISVWLFIRITKLCSNISQSIKICLLFLSVVEAIKSRRDS